MLHEVILGLSGHPSPLFDSGSKASDLVDAFPLLSPPEVALLSSIGQLARRHREVRDEAEQIAKSHNSTTCRAVAGSISLAQLARFRQKVLDVEANILKKDASTVAAYEIVPLAGIVAEFGGWQRRMEWLHGIAAYMLSPDGNDRDRKRRQATGADLINKLRKEAQTGYPDIEEMATELSRVAETAWLRQLSTWVLYGKLPSIGTSDFAVRAVQSEESRLFEMDSAKLPSFVSPETADSILFIGRSLDQIRVRGLVSDQSLDGHMLSESDLRPVHLQSLRSISIPITPAGLSSAISSIRTSLSQNTLQQMLPVHKIIETLTLLYEFFLLGRGEFSSILIDEADKHIDTDGNKTAQRLHGISIKESELSETLSKSFAILSAVSSDLHDEDDSQDAILELARSLLRLRLDKSTPRSKGQIAFNDMLVPIPANLAMKLSSPLDLFLSPSDLSVYARINAYLLAVERAHMHLTSLWRLTTIRRDHPCPPGPPLSTTASGQAILRRRRLRRRKREAQGRRVWATIGKAVYFLTELIMHLEGSVVQSAWHELRNTVNGGSSPKSSASEDTRSPLMASTRIEPQPSLGAQGVLMSSVAGSRPSTRGHVPSRSTGDPSALAALHQVYLSTLSDALLLNSFAFTKELKPLLVSVENLVAQMKRLETVQINLDLEEDDGVVDGLNDWQKEEGGVLLELDRARKKIDEGLGACIDVLGQMDLGNERTLLAWDGAGNAQSSPVAASHPEWKWRAPGVGRLLMKLEFGNVQRADSDADDTQ